MTDPVANVGSEQQIAELPKNKESEVEVEGVDHVTLSENHVDKQSSESPKEADFSDKTKPVEISVEDGLPLKPDNAGNMLLEGGDGTNLEKPLCDPPLEKQIDYHAVAPITQIETVSEQRGSLDVKAKEDNEIDSTSLENKNGPVEINARECHAEDNQNNTTLQEENTGEEHSMPAGDSNRSFTFEPGLDGNDSGSEEEQSAFMRELENFHRERSLEFKPPKFYGEGLNCLKLWRTVARLGGYDQVTVSKLWRQVGESFNPPKTCTTISWSFRNFYEKALLEYEKYKIQSGELKFSTVDLPGSTNADNLVGGNQASGSGRAVRDAAARAMQGWHTQRLFDGGEAGDPIMKDKNSPFLKRDKQHKSIGPLKKRKAAKLEHEAKLAKTDPTKPLDDIVIIDVGVPADWVKINVQRTAYIEQFYCPDGNVSFKQHDCFEVYALVPGLLREEVQVQSDPAGRLIISGEPEQPDNPWGVTAFKKVITLPARIDPHQTSAVVTLHGQLLVRAPLEVPGV